MKILNKLVENALVCIPLVLLLTACTNENLKKTSTQPVNNTALNINIWPTLDIEVKKDAEIEQKIISILIKMTLEQKVAQMIQPELRDFTVEDMRKYGFGAYLNGGGSINTGNTPATPKDWLNVAEAMYQASIDDSLDGIKIPTMWGTDAVHGHNSVIGATLFPHNIGLGAANNPALIEKIAEITAKEVMVTGIDWVFAPTVAVVRDDRWGRTYEGYSEDPDIVRTYSAAMVKGLQGRANKDFLNENHVISSVKHFIGDGGTQAGDDQGDNLATEQALFDIHAQGYVGGLSAGAQSVMASFNSWHGKKSHGYQYLLTEVLKNKMGFDGFVVGDWNGHGQVAGCSNVSCPQAVNAGLDLFMVPTGAWKPLLENTILQVRNGEISQARIDDAVSRILRVKLRAGLFEKTNPAQRQFSGKTELIGAQAHRNVARQAVRESLVLLKNKNHLLPLSPKQHILVAGDGANNIGKQAGGWSVTWQGTGTSNNDFPGATSIYDGIAQQVEIAGGTATLSETGSYQEKPDVAIVVFGEQPYAEGHGDREHLEFQHGDKKDLALLKQFKQQGIPVVALFISGRPMWVNAELNAADAFVAIWLPGSEGRGVADVILAKVNGDVQYNFTGKLSYSWPKTAVQTAVNRHDENYEPLLPYGFGLKYGDKNILADNLDETTVHTKQENLTHQTNLKREIFIGSTVPPWELWLFSGAQQLSVTSNTHQLNNMKYRTVDKKIQEDAFKITLNGDVKSGVKLVSKNNTKEDLSASLAVGSALQFSVKLNTKADKKVMLSMYCAEQNQAVDQSKCGHSQDISELLNQQPLHQWRVLSIDLSCFNHVDNTNMNSDTGMNFSETITPFELSSAGKLDISLADISLIAAKNNQSSMNCQ